MSRIPLKELQSARITRAAKSFDGNAPHDVILPAGSIGAVVTVLGDPDNPRCYLIEFHLEKTNEFVVADVLAEFVEPNDYFVAHHGTTTMKIIDLDANDWKAPSDFYDAFLAAVGAPEWHGRSPGAVNDSVIWGGINALEPPYTVKIKGLSAAPENVREKVEISKRALAEGRKEYQERNRCDIEVAIQLLS